MTIQSLSRFGEDGGGKAFAPFYYAEDKPIQTRNIERAKMGKRGDSPFPIPYPNHSRTDNPPKMPLPLKKPLITMERVRRTPPPI